jgi:hypothetical protein
MLMMCMSKKSLLLRTGLTLSVLSPFVLTPFNLDKSKRGRFSLAVGLFGKDYRHAVVFV